MPKGFDWLWFCLHGTLLPAGGEGGRRKRKEPHDGKKSSHTDTTETLSDFCVHAALGRLRFVSGSTAQLLYLVDFSISGTGVRVKIHGEKSVRVGVKNALQRGWGLRFERIASTASVCTLAEKRCLPYRSDLLISKHIRCGHTPEKWAFRTVCRIAIFLFWESPKPTKRRGRNPI